MALIYILEDDESIREIEMIALRNGGHEVESFGRARAQELGGRGDDCDGEILIPEKEKCDAA